MRAVNLLPQKHRPAAPTGERSGSAYVVLGVLGALLVCVVLYVLTVNSINSSKEQIAQAEKETQEADAKTQALQPYGDFSQVAQTRLSSVKQQAQSRIDWERLVRELAHVTPEGVWLTSADGAIDGSKIEGASDKGLSGPTVRLTGCAHNQADVATTLVRLRRISGATDVKLSESTQGEDAPAGATAGAAAATTSTASPEDCGTHNKRPNYKWDVAVTFDAAAAANAGSAGAEGSEQVPARLGGGS